MSFIDKILEKLKLRKVNKEPKFEKGDAAVEENGILKPVGQGKYFKFRMNGKEFTGCYFMHENELMYEYLNVEDIEQ